MEDTGESAFVGSVEKGYNFFYIGKIKSCGTSRQKYPEKIWSYSRSQRRPVEARGQVWGVISIWSF